MCDHRYDSTTHATIKQLTEKGEGHACRYIWTTVLYDMTDSPHLS
jgi:hypothetical protein